MVENMRKHGFPGVIGSSRELPPNPATVDIPGDTFEARFGSRASPPPQVSLPKSRFPSLDGIFLPLAKADRLMRVMQIVGRGDQSPHPD